MSPGKVVIAGGTGLTGRNVISILAETDACDRIYSLGRRTKSPDSEKLISRKVDFADPTTMFSGVEADTAFCCLGTTMKKAGSKEAFSEVDHDFVLNYANAARDAGVGRFLVISAMGADVSSRFFYNRVKGKMEQDLRALGFPILHILRPSLLVGGRSENRTGEKIGAALLSFLNVLLIGPLRKYRSIQANTVAKAMVHLAFQEEEGAFVHPSDELQTLGKE